MHGLLNSLVLEMFSVPVSGCEILLFHQAENQGWPSKLPPKYSKWGVSLKYD